MDTEHGAAGLPAASFPQGLQPHAAGSGDIPWATELHWMAGSG